MRPNLQSLISRKAVQRGKLQRPGDAPGQPGAAVGGADALDQPRELQRRKGPGGHGHRGHRRLRGPRPGPGWKVSPSIKIAPGEVRTLADIEGAGAIQQIWMTPTGRWRNSILRIYWDGAGAARRRVPGRRLLRLRLAEIQPGLLAGRVREPRQRLQLLLGDALPQERAHHHDQHGRRGDDALLPDQLRADRRSRRRAPTSTPSSAARTRCPTSRSTPSWTACEGAGTTSAPTWPGA